MSHIDMLEGCLVCWDVEGLLKIIAYFMGTVMQLSYACGCVSSRVPHFYTIALIRQSCVSVCVSENQRLKAGNTFMAVADKQIKKL